jgi:hypothetical protein
MWFIRGSFAKKDTSLQSNCYWVPEPPGQRAIPHLRAQRLYLEAVRAKAGMYTRMYTSRAEMYTRFTGVY